MNGGRRYSRAAGLVSRHHPTIKAKGEIASARTARTGRWENQYSGSRSAQIGQIAPAAISMNPLRVRPVGLRSSHCLSLCRMSGIHSLIGTRTGLREGG